MARTEKTKSRKRAVKKAAAPHRPVAMSAETEEARLALARFNEAEKETLRRRAEMMQLGVRLARKTIIKWHDRDTPPSKDEMEELLKALSWPIEAAIYHDAVPGANAPLDDTIERLTEKIAALEP
jgi:4-alpha-glucanotransferase